ncbi:hypothetical protein ABIB75_007253 [Bradyrhizobium sp. GM2.2]
MVLFSIHPVPETLKFCELRGKGFETLAKNSGRVVHSSADFHVSSPSNMSARIPPALTWAKKICNQRKTRLIRHAALPMTMRRRVKKVLMCPGARHAPLGLAAQLATTTDRTVAKARSGLRSKVEWRLARTRACASARRLLHLHNRPLHMRPDFRSSLPSRKVLRHRSLRPICRPRRMAFQQQMSHHGAPQVRHYLQVTRRQRTPRPQRTDDRC